MKKSIFHGYPWAINPHIINDISVIISVTSAVKYNSWYLRDRLQLSFSCIWHVVYHNRKISINFRAMVSEVTTVHFIDQMRSPNILSSCLPSTSQLYCLLPAKCYYHAISTVCYILNNQTCQEISPRSN